MMSILTSIWYSTDNRIIKVRVSSSLRPSPSAAKSRPSSLIPTNNRWLISMRFFRFDSLDRNWWIVNRHSLIERPLCPLLLQWEENWPQKTIKSLSEVESMTLRLRRMISITRLLVTNVFPIGWVLRHRQ